MQTSDVLIEAYGRIQGTVHKATSGLTSEELAFRPEEGANSIAWLVWHLTRVQDDHLSEIAGREQAWTAEGWHRALDLPFEPADSGQGHTPEQVAKVRGVGPQPLLDYHDAVMGRSRELLTTLTGPDLDRVIDRSYDPPVSVGTRLVSVISDNIQHAGQARYVRGIVERRG